MCLIVIIPLCSLFIDDDGILNSVFIVEVEKMVGGFQLNCILMLLMVRVVASL